MATSTSSRSAGSAAGRSARRSSVSQLAGIGERLARAREGSDHGVTRPISADRSVRAAALREREQAPSLSVLQIFRSVVDDPVAGCARPAPRTIAAARPGEADVIVIIGRPDRPELHRRPEPESANNNPLKRNGDVDQQPQRRLEPVGQLGAARQSALESAAPRARA